MPRRPRPSRGDPLSTHDSLRRFCDKARAEGAIAIDLEFQRERTYWAKLCLVQAATRDEARIVDPLARDTDLSPFLEVVTDPAVEVVLHSGGQDMEILYRRALRPPANVFDTQIAAALLGLGDQMGYGALVKEVTGTKLEKLETLTDWTKRPLTPAQIEYALDDVRYLLPIRDALRARLEEKGRLPWLVEETRHYEEVATYEPDPRLAWRRLPRTRSLEGRGLSILRELAAWREETARAQDMPRGHVVTDEILVEVARRSPKHPRDLTAIRGVHEGIVNRHGAALVEAVARGAAAPPEEHPESAAGERADPEATALLDVLDIVLKLAATKAEIAPSYVGTRRDVVELVEHVRAGAGGGTGAGTTAGEAPALLKGWRRELAGEALLEALAGRTGLHVDPETGRVVSGRI